MDRNLLENEGWWPDAHMNPTNNSKGLRDPLKFSSFFVRTIEILTQEKPFLGFVLL